MRITKLLDRSEGVAPEVKKLHIENLHRVVQYCENKSDCRRALILNYFGEDFSSELCKKNKKTVCDNCDSKVTHEVKDYTQIAQIVVESIKKISGFKQIMMIMALHSIRGF